MATLADGPVFGNVNADLYAKNAFRVSGLPVNATTGDIQHRSEQLRVAPQLEMDTAVDSGQEVLPLAERPDATAVADALERLRDPARRLVDELFWFWPAEDGGQDRAMAALRHGDPDAAMSVWEDMSGGSDPGAAVAVHNMATLTHIRALEDPRTISISLWRVAFRWWSSVSVSDSFWELVTSRIRELSDPRLTPATVWKMRDALPAALLSINARLALQANREDRPENALVHVTLMRNSGFGEETVNRVLRQHADPILAQLRSMSQDAKRSADNRPAQGVEAARELLEQAKPPLSDVEVLLAQEDPLLQGIRDEVASTVLYCAIAYVNKTNDPKRGLRVLYAALPVAATDTAKNRIQENIHDDLGKIILANINAPKNVPTLEDLLRQHVKQDGGPFLPVRTLPGAEGLARGSRAERQHSVLLDGTCWFDKTNPATVADAYPQKMYGNARKIGTAFAWDAGTVNVPRCAACRQAHAMRLRTNKMKVWSASAGAIALGVLFGAVGILPLAALLIILSLILMPIGIFISLGSGIPEEQRRTLRDFDPIAALLASGWRFSAYR